MPKNLLRCATAAVIAVALIAGATPAAAHIAANPRTATAGGYATIGFQVPHGCGGQPTRALSVKLREDITGVKAQAVPGWSVTYERQPLSQPIDDHGRRITDYIAVVTWTTEGTPLPDDQYMTFGISMKLPDLPGERVLFPAVQECVDGSEGAWVGDDPKGEYPAPAVLLEQAAAGHGAAGVVLAATSTGSSGTDGVARSIAVLAIVLAAASAVVTLRRRTA